MKKFAKTGFIVLVMFLISTMGIPVARAQEEPPEDFMTGFLGAIVGNFLKLDVKVSTGVINLQDETATIYVSVHTGGIPVDPENLVIILWYDSPEDLSVDPPVPWGFWEIRDGADIDHGLGSIWHAEYQNPDTGELIEIPGLYVVTWTYGFLPGDYLIEAHAQTPLSLAMVEEEVDIPEEEEGLIGMLQSTGYGAYSTTVSETSTVAAYGTLAMAEALEEMGAAFVEMTALLEGMGGSFEELGTSMEGFVEVIEASGVEIEGLQGEVATVSADIGEMLLALPELYEQALRIQQVTTAGVPIAYVLSAIAAVTSIIAVVLMVRMRRDFAAR